MIIASCRNFPLVQFLLNLFRCSAYRWSHISILRSRLIKWIIARNSTEIKINSNLSTFESSYNVLGIHRYSYHKRGYRILSESSSLLSENSLAIQNLVSRSRNEISRADLINITPRSIPRRSVDACTHASIAQTGEYRLPRACITRATRATCNRPFRAPSTPRSDTVIDPGIDRSIARPCDKGTESCLGGKPRSILGFD